MSNPLQPFANVHDSNLEARVEALLAEFTLEEKIAFIHGNTKFSSAGVERLGIPDRWLTDGPHGIREEITPHGWNAAGWSNDYATALPISIGLAATWNPDLALQAGEMLGAEARARKKEFFLAPGVNIQRTPLCGRTFEYLGEDPFLASRIAVGYIRGVQSQGVAACVKHLAVNNQEIERGTIDVEVDERTLREIYLPVFRAAVEEAGVWAVMGAYNKFRGQWCSHNDYLINRILKGEWGFCGVLMSDWAATHDTDEAVLCGLDLEMGTDLDYDEFFLARAFREGIESGKYPIALLDDKVRRNLRVVLANGALNPPADRSPGALATPAHRALSRKVAEEAIVLLRNENAILPLDLPQLRSIAVIGENATRRHSMGGFGAGVKVMHEVHVLEGITLAAGLGADVTFSMGYTSKPESAESGNDLIARAVAAARVADVAILFVGLGRAPYSDDEATDRPDLDLPFGQNELIRQVAAANPRTVVVMVSGSPVAMPWLAEVPAVVQAWYGGVEAGNAVAGVLFGTVTPSGKLPCTFPKRLADIAAHAHGPEVYPGVDGKVVYREGLMVGYRHFDTAGIEPLFAFGHGLSYTTFGYANLVLEPTDRGFLAISFDLTNLEAKPGAEIAQVYVQDLVASVYRPSKELKGFTKVALAPGETQRATVVLDPRAFMFFDIGKNGWLAEAGDFEIHVGSSSRDIRLTGRFSLADSIFEALPTVAKGGVD